MAETTGVPVVRTELTLSSTGAKMPAFGLGTWAAAPGEVGQAVTNALEAGYKLIDCAAVYDNEKEVGAAIADAISRGVIARKDLFVTSKLWNTEHAPDKVEAACRKSMSSLGLDYLDLYLIHWPTCMPFGHKSEDPLPPQIPIEDTWKAMEHLVDIGLVRNIGVSNWTVTKLKRILAMARIPPAVDQVEFTPMHQQMPLRAFCAEHGIAVTGYSPLGSNASALRGDVPNLLTHPVIKEIAAKHGANTTTAQVILNWGMRLGVSVIPKSVHKERIIENFRSAALTLDSEDMAKMAGLEAHMRTARADFLFTPGQTEADFWDNE